MICYRLGIVFLPLLPETITYANYHYQEQCDIQDHVFHTVFVNVTRLAKLIRF
jgi:hypothetical protein